MSVSHIVYGLRLAADMALPGLSPQYGFEIPDTQIRLKDRWRFPAESSAFSESLYSSPGGMSGGQPNLRVGVLPDREYFGFFYGDGARYVVDRRGREVWADWPENYSLEDACTYLLGPVLGFVLRLRGTVCLHASSVAINHRAIALVGLPGAGKSTVAAAFGCAGFPILSDDVVALVDHGTEFLVPPGYPRVNLWPDAVRSLFGSEDALPRITPTWDKRYLPLGQNGHAFASTPLPLGAIYVLNSRDETLSAPVIEEVSGQEAFMALAANTYVNYLLDQDMQRTEFDMLGGLVSSTPVRRVRPRAEPSAIFDLCQAIAADAQRVIAPAPATATPLSG